MTSTSFQEFSSRATELNPSAPNLTYFGLDFETTGLNVYGLEDVLGWCVMLPGEDKVRKVRATDRNSGELQEWLKEWPFLAHNALFELMVIEAMGLEIDHVPHCSMLVSYLYEPFLKEFNLDALCQHHQTPIQKMEKPKSWDVWDDYMATYCSLDVYACDSLFKHVMQRLWTEHRKTYNLYMDLERPHQMALHRFNNTGMLISPTALDEIDDKISFQLLESHNIMADMVGTVPGETVTYSRKVQLNGPMVKGKTSDLFPKTYEDAEGEILDYVPNLPGATLVKENTKTNRWEYEAWGFIRDDGPKVGVHTVAGEKRYDRCDIETFSPTSNKHIEHALRNLYGWEPHKFTKSGQPSLTSQVLDDMGYDLSEKLVGHRKLFKAHSAFIVRYQSELENSDDGRLHPSFLHTRTLTGRLSSKNPNVQQVPSRGELGGEIRKLVVAPPGFVVVGCDCSNIEGRILAYYLAVSCGDENMANIFREGLDFHSMNASNWGLVSMFDGDAKTARAFAKLCLYAICYGAGASKVGKGDKELGQRLMDALASNCPALPELKQKVISRAKQRAGTVYDIMGRRLHYPCLDESYAWREAYKLTDVLPDMDHRQIARYLTKRSERQVFNALLQGSAASIFKATTTQVYQQLETSINSGDVEFVAPVHDELLLYVRESHKDHVLGVLEQEFSRAYLNNIVPLKGDPAVGMSWYDVH